MLRHYEIVLLIHPDQGEHITSTIDNYYILFNVECSKDCILELQNSFKFNDGIIRFLISNMNDKVTEPSVMMKAIEAEKNSESYDKDLQV